MCTFPLKTTIAVLAGLAAAGLIAFADDKPQLSEAETTNSQTLLKLKLEAAEVAHQGAWESLGTVRRLRDYIVPITAPDQVYTWSIRWLNAKLDTSAKAAERIAAWEAHVKRMKELFKRVEAMTPDLLPGWNKSAATWYVAEAEIGLSRQKGDPNTNARQALLKKGLDAAQEAYEGAWEIFGTTKKIDDVEMPQGSHAEVYFWSTRWLDCQLGSSDNPAERTAALAAHVKRMKELATKVTAMTPKLLYPHERAAASWYLTEARIRLANEKKKQPEALIKEQLDEAKEAFTGESKMYQVIKPSIAWQIKTEHPEKVYQYSVRWLKAQCKMIDKREDRLAAYEEHVRRIKVLQKKTTWLAENAIPKWSNSAAEWYLAEADLWLAREKAK